MNANKRCRPYETYKSKYDFSALIPELKKRPMGEIEMLEFLGYKKPEEKITSRMATVYIQIIAQLTIQTALADMGGHRYQIMSKEYYERYEMRRMQSIMEKNKEEQFNWD